MALATCGPCSAIKIQNSPGKKGSLVKQEKNDTPKIVCSNISKTFIQKGKQQVHVLEGISLEVKNNEFVVILGPGQCGKTTLLRIIAGLETPTEGSVLLDGTRIAGPGPDRGLVFQSYMLFPWKTVMGNIEMGLKLQGMARKQRRKIASHYIQLVGLEGFEKHYPHQLSGGMKQRVGIARAYANDPKVMLLDEPFGQLDAQTRLFMEKETIRIWEAEKRTVIFVTNNIDEALFLADRLITLQGKLPGRMQTVYDVHFPRPREHTDLDFLKLRQEITDASALIL